MKNITEIVRKYDTNILEAWGDSSAIAGRMENRQILRRYESGWVLDVNVNFTNIKTPLTTDQAQRIIRGDSSISYQGTISPLRQVMAQDDQGDFLVTSVNPGESDQDALRRAESYYSPEYSFYIRG